MWKDSCKIIFNNRYSILNANNPTTKNQSGFRPGDSATNQLSYLVNEIHQTFESAKFSAVRAVFLDISKAFDKGAMMDIKFKLKQNGVWQPVKVFSKLLPLVSVLGPLLFLIYINDLERNIKSSIKFCDDDTMLFSLVKDPVISADDLKHDLNNIHLWAHQWKMEFNPDKAGNLYSMERL